MTNDLKTLDWDDEFLDLKWGDGYTINDWRNNDVTYGTNNHFTKERWHIFHYSIFCNDLESSPGNPAGGVSEGPNHGFGDGFVVAEFDTIIEIASVFMHELGHNIGLYDLPHSYPEGTLTQSDSTAMTHNHDTIDYHWIEWNNLNIHYIKEGDGVHLNGPKD